MSNHVSDNDLIQAATAARQQAYCRFSGYSVGAAIVDDAGRVHVGCNVENSAYPLGSCAEAGAISAMVLEGGQRIERIAVIGGSGDPDACTPCGGCRQRIFEFADKDTIVIAMNKAGEWQHYPLADLLPVGFSLP